MSMLEHEQLTELIECRSVPCISLYLPIHPSAPEQWQEHRRLRHLVSRARHQLRALQVEGSRAESALREIERFAEDNGLARHTAGCLAFFSAPRFFRVYHIRHPLEELLIVGRRYYIKPLLPFVAVNSRLFLLALKQDSARLFQSTPNGIRQLELPAVPCEQPPLRRDWLTHDWPKAVIPIEQRTTSCVEHRYRGAAKPMKEDILSFFRRVDRSLNQVLYGQRAPLVLACVGYLASIYESVNSYRRLVRAKVPGSPDRWSLDELRQHAWTIVQPYLRHSQIRVLATFQRELRAGCASCDLAEVLRAADQGRVETLLVSRGAQRWGSVGSGIPTPRPDRRQCLDHEELLNYAAVRTLAHGGNVYTVEAIPSTDSPIAATFRN